VGASVQVAREAEQTEAGKEGKYFSFVMVQAEYGPGSRGFEIRHEIEPVPGGGEMNWLEGAAWGSPLRPE